MKISKKPFQRKKTITKRLKSQRSINEFFTEIKTTNDNIYNSKNIESPFSKFNNSENKILNIITDENIQSNKISQLINPVNKFISSKKNYFSLLGRKKLFQKKYFSTQKTNQSQENNSEDEISEISDNNNTFSNYLLNNVENILDIANLCSYLFDKNEKKYYDDYMSLTHNEKIVLLKFLKRKNKWQNINKIFNKDKNEYNGHILKEIDIIKSKLVKLKFISNFNDIFQFSKTIDYNFLFEYLYYLNNEHLNEINKNLIEILKFKNKNSNKISIDLVKQNFINNPFYNLENFIYEIEKNDLKNIIKEISEKITQINFKDNKLFENTEITKSKSKYKNGYSKHYIDTSINYSNFRSVFFKSKLTNKKKLDLINEILNKIDYYLNEQSSKFMENFAFGNIENNEQTKINNIINMIKKYDNIFYTINPEFANVIDKESRLFFFYTDIKDLNDLTKEYYEIDKYEKYDIDSKNHVFEDKSKFYLFDNLYQINLSYYISSAFFKKEEDILEYLDELYKPLIPFLLKTINNILYTKLFSENNNIFNFSEEDIEKYNDFLINDLLNYYKSNSLINNDNFSFINQYSPEYISAEILYYYASNLENSKNYFLSNLIYLFLLNTFNNYYIFNSRGAIYYRVIINYNRHINNISKAIQITNIYIENDILKFKSINEIDLLKLKNSYDGLQKKSKKKFKIKIFSYDFPEIINSNFDINLITKNITAPSQNSSKSHRRYFSEIDDEEMTVENFALNYYAKEENLKGVHGENLIILSLYTIFLWDEIFYDKIPFVFQTKYQEYPLDFYEKEFYIKRKKIIDEKLEKISKYEKEDIIKHIKEFYKIKNEIKNPYVKWKKPESLYIEIANAFDMKKLVNIFRVILKYGLKYIKIGMPDLFLWKEEKEFNLFFNNGSYCSVKNSIKLVEVKSETDRLSDYQKFWLKTFYENDIEVELLYIK